MAVDPVFEFERIRRIASAFGWIVRSTEDANGVLTITLVLTKNKEGEK